MGTVKPESFARHAVGCHGGCIHNPHGGGRQSGQGAPRPGRTAESGACLRKRETIIEQMYHPDRLKYPMRRIGPRGSGKWERITWDEALDTIADKLTQLRRGLRSRLHLRHHRHRPPPGALSVAASPRRWGSPTSPPRAL